MGKLPQSESGLRFGSGVAVEHVSHRRHDRYASDSISQRVMDMRLTDSLVLECVRPVLPVMMLLELSSVSISPSTTSSRVAIFSASLNCDGMTSMIPKTNDYMQPPSSDVLATMGKLPALPFPRYLWQANIRILKLIRVVS